MRRRDLLSAGGMASIWATTHARGPARAAGRAITAPETDFIGLLPDLLAISGVSGITIALLAGKRISWHGDFGVADKAGDVRYLFQHGSLASACTSLLHPASATRVAVFTNHSNGHRVIDRVFRAVTGREHPVFLWA